MDDASQHLELKAAAADRQKAAVEPGAGSASRRVSEMALVVGFLLVIAAVPIAQTCLELARHERVQFTDVFCYRPTAKNLRQFETNLKEKSWFQQALRPRIQRLLFMALRDTGAKGLLGRNHWLFYRPDVRYLVEPNRPEVDNTDSKWVKPGDGSTQRDSVVRAIVKFRDQLRERSIALLVVPVPGKPSVYPDEVSRREIGRQHDFRSPTLELIKSLEGQGVATVDLFSEFSRMRNPEVIHGPLYLARDTHWTPAGARLASEAVAARLRKMGLAPPATTEFRTERVLVRRWGDVLEMMQIPGLRQVFASETVACDQVLAPALSPLMPTASDRPGTYRYPGGKASILVLGDSFCRIYQYPEPQSLGELHLAGAGRVRAQEQESGSKRLLPGSAGFISHLAFALKASVDSIYSDGGASTDVRRRLSTNPGILEDKRVVIWEFVERDIARGREGWEDVPLPPKLD